MSLNNLIADKVNYFRTFCNFFQLFSFFLHKKDSPTVAALCKGKTVRKSYKLLEQGQHVGRILVCLGQH